MKAKNLLFTTFAAMILSSGVAANFVGYANLQFQPGDNWFGNPLGAGANSLSSLITIAPAGTTVSLWNSAANQYLPTVTWNGSAWSADLTLNPGTGALLHTPSFFTNTFVGDVLNFDGSPFTSAGFTEPPPFPGPNGLYLFSSKAPVALAGHTFFPGDGHYDVFEAIIGRAPHNGEQVTTLDASSQTYTTTTFLGGVWDNGDPSLQLGGAAMFNLGPVIVPEPSALGLVVAGIGMIGITRCGRRLRL
jgi:hypothetical protein